ncbi:MAG TPA: trehalose-phosphatase, partial [Candidatus Krumholzibacterium sp.]|nr:trehalose-phosphatase [Candidatus Krumholzibacterium sp.]
MISETDDKILEAFYQELRKADERLLLLDYDGTLAPFTVDRDRAFPYEGVVPKLSALNKLERCRVVVISGRSLSSLSRLLDPELVSEIWAGHGWERLTSDGRVMLPDIEGKGTEALDELQRLLVTAKLYDRYERKPASLAIHFRGIDGDPAAADMAIVMKEAFPVAEAGGLKVVRFEEGVEFMIPGNDKGTAVKAVLSETGANTAIAYLGDDFTDEDAFEALAGRGLRVLVRTENRPSAADIWLRPPEELLMFLDRWSIACKE